MEIPDVEALRLADPEDEDHLSDGGLRLCKLVGGVREQPLSSG